MESLQSKTIKVLLIVEGEDLEPGFFKQLTTVYGVNMDIYIVGTNIYALYTKMKEHDFLCNIKDVLPEVGKNLEGKAEILAGNFAYTYLIFDFDAHHKTPIERTQNIEIDAIVQNNILKLSEMAEYFVDETDPSIGKLYINYPMMESFRDCDAFFDPAYKDREISIDDLRRYKSIAGQRRLSGVALEHYSRDNFSDLTRLNVFKLNSIIAECWEVPTYPEYLGMAECSKILETQASKVNSERKVSVLNTALFVLLDYYGNQRGFYDSIMTKETSSGADEQRTKSLQEV